MTWTGYTINGVFKDLSHLQTKTIEVEIDKTLISLHVSYGDHCFTDEKDNGTIIRGRYWSEERYQRSLELPDYIKNTFIDSYAIPYLKRKKVGESYHYMEIYDYAIFFEINKPDIENTLKIKVISAYEVDSWGKGTMPKGKRFRIRWILEQRLKKHSILK